MSNAVSTTDVNRPRVAAPRVMTDVRGRCENRRRVVDDADADADADPLRDDRKNDDSYCFKWHDYRHHLSTVVRQLFEEDCMVDVTLSVAGQRIHAHRIVLCACSSLFQDVLGQVDEDCPTVILTDVSACDVKSIVEFAYRGEVRVPVENIKTLLDAARTLKIYGLTEVPDVPDLPLATAAHDIPKTDERDSSFDPFSSDVPPDREKPTLADCLADLNDDDPSARTESSATRNPVSPVPASVGRSASLFEDGSGDDDDDNNDNNGSGNDDTVQPKFLFARCANGKRPRREPTGKRSYSEDMLISAINDLRAGRTLIEASTERNIPRSTLYMRAKSLGVRLNASRNEYPAECMKAAIDAVVGGSSLQHASEMFGIPKTVLWRRMQKEGYQIFRSDVKRSYGTENREAAVRALQRGENLTKVALEFKIPKTTLFRDKARLVDEGKLPLSFWKKRKTDSEESKNTRLEEAVAACKGGRMSQAAASVAYHIPKTTIWRRLQRQQQQQPHQQQRRQQQQRQRRRQRPSNPDDNRLVDARLPHPLDDELPKPDERRVAWTTESLDRRESEELSSLTALSAQHESDFTYCEAIAVSEADAIPVTYMDESGEIPEESVIILTTNDVVDRLDLEEGERIIVGSESAREYVPCDIGMPAVEEAEEEDEEEDDEREERDEEEDANYRPVDS